jgi:succinate dehydrogenase hydrophobic anchor subunit
MTDKEFAWTVIVSLAFGLLFVISDIIDSEALLKLLLFVAVLALVSLLGFSVYTVMQ